MSMKKSYIAIAAVLFAAASVATVFAVRSHNRMDDFFRANVDALSNTEAVSCPDPYDVKNYMLEFPMFTEVVTIGINGDVTLAGKKFTLGGFSIGAEVKITYQLSQCSKPSEGNCCPNSRNGEVRILGYKLN